MNGNGKELRQPRQAHHPQAAPLLRMGQPLFGLDTFVEPPLPHHLLKIEDVAADEEIALSPFLKVIREVTDDPEWYNANIAKRN